MLCSRVDLRHPISQIRGWYESRTMFSRAPTAPTTAHRATGVVDPLQQKEAKWGGYKRQLLQELEGLRD